MRRIWTIGLVFLLAAGLGCTGRGEKGQNKDLDRPKPAKEAEK